MSMNKYMHPRNIYKAPPDFKQLAIDYPEFRKFAKQDVTGKITINFKDVSALRALTATLLKKDFNLDVTIPLNKLIPTVPLRLNYILWIEDLLGISGIYSDIKGIDIGTGASCVYPLMAARKYKWKMIATDIDLDSIKIAEENIKKNNLEEFITVRKVNEDNVLLQVADKERFDFCMCNPPFFSAVQELHPFFKARKDSRPRPRNAFCAATSEVVTNGGEIEFITNIINESKIIKERIRIYTTMVGHKSSLNPLKILLREAGVRSFKQTNFCQGYTTRWGLAWTFCDIDLRKIPQQTVVASKKQKTKQPLKYMIPANSELAVEDFVRPTITVLNDLQIDFEEIKHSKNILAYNIVARKNTWSHQRRKRREMKRLTNSSETNLTSTNNSKVHSVELIPDTLITNSNGECSAPSQDTTMENLYDQTTNGSGYRSTTPELDNFVNFLADINIQVSPESVKRDFEDEEDDAYYEHKRIKMDCKEGQEQFYLKCLLVIRREESNFSVELSWIDGIENRDILHQILQYIKNNLKLQ